MVRLSLDPAAGGPAPLGLALLLLIGIAACQGGRSPEGPLQVLAGAVPEEVSGWRASEPGTVYDSESIFTYIDGHAEVYLAYGMRQCLARRYTGPVGEADVVLDVFEMASPEDAFGVFTHDRDGEPVDVGNDGLLRYGWLSYWRGPFFVSIYAEGESEASREAVLELGRAVAITIGEDGERPAIVDSLPATGLEHQSVRFLRSHQILNSHIYVADDNVLDLGPDTSAVLGRYRRGDDSGYLLLVDYADAGRREAAARAFAAEFLVGEPGAGPRQAEDGGWYGVGGADARLAAVLAADSEGVAAALMSDALAGEAP
jgi:hypothetical protein